MRTTLILAGALAAAGAAAPAAAQYHPPRDPGGVLGAVLNAYNYGRYPYGNYGYNMYGNARYGVDRCARAVEARLNRTGYNWYSGTRYNRYRNHGRVEGITRVDRKKYGLKVSGVASSGWGGYTGWNRPGYGTYGYHAGADLRFTCEIRHNGQIRDLDIKRRPARWRGY